MSAPQLAECSVEESASLLAALRAVDSGGIGVALVVARNGALQGLLTDGDIRRAILSGATLQTPIGTFVRRNYSFATPRTSRVEVLELMQARTIQHVPIIDDAGHLVGLHLLHDVIRRVACPSWAVVMAGGRGTRLAPLTDVVPKPMLTVAGRPILERLVLHLAGFGIRRIYLAVNHLRGVIEDHFGDGSAFGCEIEYLREERPLGTGGALSLLPQLPTHPLIVLNGDLVTQIDIERMLDFHRAGGQLATMGVRRYVHVIPFGCLGVEGDRILGFEEKPELVRLINAGIYVLDPELVARVPRDTDFALPTLFKELLERGEVARCFEVEDDWIDVGRREQLARARLGGTGS